MTTAAETKFCTDVVETRIHGLHLWVDGNQKIATNGDYDNPKPNALSIQHVKDCPFATQTCKQSCYVHGLKKHAPGTYKMYKHNSQTLNKAMELAADGCIQEARTLERALAGWIQENSPEAFRWHVSGDVFSEEYARWIVQVCQRTPNTKHWIYTRSLPYVKVLALANNLAINISADETNLEDVLSHPWNEVPGGWGRINLTYLTQSGVIPASIWLTVEVIFPDYPLRGDEKWAEQLRNGYFGNVDLWPTVCPVDFFGKSADINCNVCRRCLQ